MAKAKEVIQTVYYILSKIKQADKSGIIKINNAKSGAIYEIRRSYRSHLN